MSAVTRENLQHQTNTHIKIIQKQSQPDKRDFNFNGEKSNSQQDHSQITSYAVNASFFKKSQC